MLDVILGAIVEVTNTPPPPKITPAIVRAETHKIAVSRGYSDREWMCLDLIIKRESNYRHKAVNGSHYGIGQVRGMKHGTGYKRQINKVLEYIDSRYGTACKAYKFHKLHNWY